RVARAAYFRAHLVEAAADVRDLGLRRGILDDARTARERSRHQRRVGAADRHFGKFDLAALEAVPGAGDDIAAVDFDIGPQPLERHDQKVDRARADGQAAQLQQLGFAHARDQRSDYQEARSQGPDPLARTVSIDEM